MWSNIKIHLCNYADYFFCSDPATHAERDRVLAIITDMGHKAARAKYDHLDRRGLMAVSFLRVKHERKRPSIYLTRYHYELTEQAIQRHLAAQG